MAAQSTSPNKVENHAQRRWLIIGAVAGLILLVALAYAIYSRSGSGEPAVAQAQAGAKAQAPAGTQAQPPGMPPAPSTPAAQPPVAAPAPAGPEKSVAAGPIEDWRPNPFADWPRPPVEVEAAPVTAVTAGLNVPTLSDRYHWSLPGPREKRLDLGPIKTLQTVPGYERRYPVPVPPPTRPFPPGPPGAMEAPDVRYAAVLMTGTPRGIVELGDGSNVWEVVGPGSILYGGRYIVEQLTDKMLVLRDGTGRRWYAELRARKEAAAPAVGPTPAGPARGPGLPPPGAAPPGTPGMPTGRGPG